MSTYRVLFTDFPDYPNNRPYASLEKFDGENGREQALKHAILLSDTWTMVEVVEVVARVNSNMRHLTDGLRYETREG